MPEISPLQNAPQELVCAKFGDRFVAYALDTIPFVAGFIATLFIVMVRLQALPPVPRSVERLGAWWLGLMLLYQFAGNLCGASIGKRLMGLKVVRQDGTSLGFFRSFVRTLGWVLSTPFFNFGFLIALFHPQTRTLHDILSGAVVIEARPKSRSETFVLAVAGLITAAGLFFGQIYWNMTRSLPSDLLAIQKAQEGLVILARIEEAYQVQNGSYTKSLNDLAEASGNVEEFKRSMLEIFDPYLFRVEAGTRRYRISAAAKDRHKTRVSIEGPLP